MTIIVVYCASIYNRINYSLAPDVFDYLVLHIFDGLKRILGGFFSHIKQVPSQITNN